MEDFGAYSVTDWRHAGRADPRRTGSREESREEGRRAGAGSDAQAPRAS